MTETQNSPGAANAGADSPAEKRHPQLTRRGVADADLRRAEPIELHPNTLPVAKIADEGSWFGRSVFLVVCPCHGSAQTYARPGSGRTWHADGTVSWSYSPAPYVVDCQVTGQPFRVEEQGGGRA